MYGLRVSVQFPDGSVREVPAELSYDDDLDVIQRPIDGPRVNRPRPTYDARWEFMEMVGAPGWRAVERYT